MNELPIGSVTEEPIGRREALRRVVTVSLALAALERTSLGAAGGRVKGIGTDPNLFKKEIPWPLVLTDAEKKAVKSLADVMLPADEFGPAASAVGVPEFLNEWVSAPYELQAKDLAVFQKGLAWLDAESTQRFGKVFADAAPGQQTALLDDIVKDGTDARKAGAEFFELFRDRAACGYFATREGWKAIGYVGNVPLTEFPGPPPEVLKHLGLE